MFAVVDHAAVEGCASAVFSGFVELVEGVEGGSAGSAEYSGDEVWVVGGEFFHGAWAVVGDFEEDGSSA